MTAVPLGLSNYVRNLTDAPPVVLRNMILEKDPTNLVDGYVRFQRPGLKVFAEIGKGPILGIFKQLGTFDGDIIALSGSELYRIDENATATRLGALVSDGRVQIAASQTRALIATGGTCYSTDGLTVSRVTVPDIDGVASGIRSVAYINGYFVLVVTDSQHFFWIAPGETNPDALSFASAENSPDNIAHVEHIGDELWLFGEGRSTEVWTPTGDKDLPFQRVEGRLFDQGCSNRDTVAKLDNTLFWAGSDGKVYRGNEVPVRVSDNSIEEQLYNTPVTNLRAWAFPFQGHEFYCLTIGGKGTFVFDVSTGTWSEFGSYERASWRAHMGASTSGRFVAAGDDEEGIIWQLSPKLSNDNGSPMLREIIGGVAILGTPVPCASFSFVAARGIGNANQPGKTPVVQLWFSDDGGHNWEGPFEEHMGAVGHYSGETAYTRLGMMRPPGRLFKLRFSEDCMFRLSYARCNEWQAA